jgi:hypothetical protein
MIDMDEQYMCLQTNATADQLWERWELLRELLDKLGQDMALASDRWNEATDPVARQELWVAFEVASREYRVLCSWKGLYYAAYVFSTDGSDCTALNVVSSEVS